MGTTQQRLDVYRDAAAPIERRIEDLLSQMTREEKLRQLDAYLAASFMTAATVPQTNVGPAANPKIRWDVVMTVIGDDGIGCIHSPSGLTKANNQLQQYAMQQTRLGIPILFSEGALGRLPPPDGAGREAEARPSGYGNHGEESLNLKVARVLRIKFKLGLFEQPYATL